MRGYREFKSFCQTWKQIEFQDSVEKDVILLAPRAREIVLAVGVLVVHRHVEPPSLPKDPTYNEGLPVFNQVAGTSVYHTV